MPIPKTSSGEMPFLDHLEELRWRIIYSLIGILIGVTIGLVVAFKFDVVELLQAPIHDYLHGRKLVVLNPMDAFSIRIQIAFVIGLAAAAPIVAYQLWAFMSPALHKPEKRIMIPVLVSALVLFMIGVAMSWFIVLPMSLRWLDGLMGTSLEPMIAASEYFGL